VKVYKKIHTNSNNNIHNMPEGPEAKFLAEKLSRELHGKTLHSIEILAGRYKTHGPPENFTKFVATFPTKLSKIYTKGKVIIFEFANGWNIISKLGLMGWWYTKDKPTWRKEYKNILFHFKDGNISKELTYSDTLSYGTLKFTNDNVKIEKELNKLGVDILDSNITQAKFIEAFTSLSNTNKNKPIEDIIIDQHLALCGIGNYLKAETLYAAKISPLRKCSDISQKEYAALYKAVRIVSRRFLYALWHDHSRNKETYLNQFRVYRQEYDPYNNPVKIHKSKTGRSTFWVPSVQK
jgi:formamidopyrimidine-DNA glycosylase